MRALLEFDRVTKRYATVDALRDVSFRVSEGEIFALLGPNGAGKTTAVRMLVGITKPDSGSIRLELPGDERSPASVRMRSRLGYLPEERGLYVDRPALATLAYFGTLRGMARSDAEASAREWLERLGLGDRASDKIETLSKGNQQRVQIIAAILHRPTLAVLDEPFSGLDPVHQDTVVSLIHELRGKGMAVLLSAHQMDLVERLADRVLLLSRGREVISGTIEELRSRFRGRPSLRFELEGPIDPAPLRGDPAIADATVEDDGSLRVVATHDDLSEALRHVASLGGVRAVTTERPRLHDIYVRAVRESEDALPAERA
jgi:ABC-2 type transport system ATP-binding protein